MKDRIALALAIACLTAPAFAGEQTCEASPSRSRSEFQISPDGTEVLDIKTRLIWHRCIEGQTWTGSTCQADNPEEPNPGPGMTYQAALHFAASISTPGKAWRLPTKRELFTIREPHCYNPSFSLELFPTSPKWSSDGFFWTSTPENGGVAVFDAIGASDANSKTTGDRMNHVRLVRVNPPPPKPAAAK